MTSYFLTMMMDYHNDMAVYYSYIPGLTNRKDELYHSKEYDKYYDEWWENFGKQRIYAYDYE